MKKELFEWAILIWTSLLVLLITGWVMIEFYNWKVTIVAAIITFVGAVIGGSITLIGVRKTIIDSRNKDYIRDIPERIKITNKEKEYIFEFQMEFFRLEKLKNENQDEFVEFLYKSNSDMINRIHDKELLKLGKDLYDLYNKIIKNTFRLYAFFKYIPFEELVDYDEVSSELYYACSEYFELSEDLIKDITQEYYKIYD